jgi:isopentenyl diphosphate isomerase/L-lactate dehydrogenase-like FMN-dependent dehydrogenase
VGYHEIFEQGLERVRSIGMEPYLDLGAETRSQNRLNRAHMDSFVFEMRLLDSQQADTSTTLFGARLRAPIVAAAICESRILKRLGPWDPPYLEQIAAGLADTGSLMSTGMVSLDELGRIVDQGAPVLHIVKPYRNDEVVLRHLERAAELGCVAVGMDVDVFFLEKAWDEVPGPALLGHKTLDDIRRFRAATKLPFVIKGVLGAHDARLARDLGADGLIVSFHGGETIDYAMPVLQALPVVRRECPDLPILVDSGFRRGADVLKALALGASGVGIATLLVIACAGGGRDGVRAMMEALYEELGRTMSITGCRSVDAIDASVLHRVDLAAQAPI